jgi:hypothetical protein
MDMQAWAWQEMKGARLGDVRARGSMADVCARLAAQPGLAFSTAVGHAGRQAASRVFGNTQVGVPELLAGHVTQTVARGSGEDWLLAAQDTTELEFTRLVPNPGVGPSQIPRVVRRLQAHSVLALTTDGLPLGVLHLQVWERPKSDAPPSAAAAGAGREARRRQPTQDKESRKWLEGLRGLEAALPPEQRVLLIQDREGDVFAFLAAPRRPHTHLLVRAAQPRCVTLPTPEADAASTLLVCAATAPVCGTLTVRVLARPGAAAGAEPKERWAVLTLRATPVVVQPPTHRVPGEPATPQAVWVLQAAEEAPPVGQAAVCWVLVTTVPLTGEQLPEWVPRLVGYYALRWRIERLHYTLKSGLQVEAVQHDEPALPQVLALYYLVAWRLLWCTYWGRTAPTAPASSVLEAPVVAVLAAASRQPVVTAHDVVLALARLGGYQPYRSAKPPGVKRLWQGYRRLQDLVLGYQLRSGAPQSNLPYV